MGGSVPFEQALAGRLGVMQPSQDDLRRFLEQHPPKVRTDFIQQVMIKVSPLKLHVASCQQWPAPPWCMLGSQRR
jgi:hypothetical protein